MIQIALFMVKTIIYRFLIEFDNIQPTEDWVKSIKPSLVRANPLNENSVMSWINVQKEIRSKQMLLIQDNIDSTLTATADLAISAGAAFVLALKFAGTHDSRACSVIKSIFLKIHKFMNYESQYREYFISRYLFIWHS